MTICTGKTYFKHVFLYKLSALTDGILPRHPVSVGPRGRAALLVLQAFDGDADVDGDVLELGQGGFPIIAAFEIYVGV